MIYYPLGVLMLAGIRDILIISTPRDLPRFEECWATAAIMGSSCLTPSRPSPAALPRPSSSGARFIGSDPVALILGDNIFYGAGLAEQMRKRPAPREGATVFAYAVDDPDRYGVVEFDRSARRSTSIEEARASRVRTGP